MPGKYWDALMDVAVDNGGYVTPALVAPLGVPAVELRKMVSRGTLLAAARGVYRVPSLPVDRYDELILARLWAAGRGVISHDSALLVHELCDNNPTKVHLTIPTAYRLSRAGGEHYSIHRADLAPEEVTQIEAITLTTIRRTLTDSVATVPAYLIRQAVDTARARGAIGRRSRIASRARSTGSSRDDGPAAWSQGVPAPAPAPCRGDRPAPAAGNAPGPGRGGVRHARRRPPR